MSPLRRLGALGALLCSCAPSPQLRAQVVALVPRERIAKGTELSADLLEARPVDAALVTEDALKPDTELPSGSTAAFDLEPGQPVLASTLIPSPTSDLGRGRFAKGFRSVNLEVAEADSVRPLDLVDLQITLRDRQTGEDMTMTLLQEVQVLSVGPGTTAGTRRLALKLLPEEVEVLLEGMHLGTIEVTLRNPEDIDFQEERGRATLTTLFTGERINTLLKKRVMTIQVIKGTSEKASSSTPEATSTPPSGPALYAGHSGPQAGQITSGEWDDDVNLSRLQAYLADFHREHPDFPVLPSADRAEIKVENEMGLPLPDAKVEVRADGKVLFAGRTAADGRLLYFPSIDGRSTGGELTLRVEAPGGLGAVEQEGSPSQKEWRVVVAGAQPEASTALDLAFVLDTTGSMDDELAYLNREIDWIAGEVARTNPGISVRYGLVVYKDRHSHDPYVVRGYDFSDLATFRGRLAAQQAGGGGDYPEAMEEAAKVMNGLSWRPGHVTRVAFLVADAPPHTWAVNAFFDEVKNARVKGIHLYPVAASGAQDDVEFVMRQTAQLTQARYLFLTDDSGVGGSHAKPHLPCYRVQHLNRMIARMVREELDGKRVVPAESEVVRTVGHPRGGTCADE